jgi:hypothetical protein
VKGAKVTRSADSLEFLLPGADLRRDKGGFKILPPKVNS